MSGEGINESVITCMYHRQYRQACMAKVYSLMQSTVRTVSFHYSKHGLSMYSLSPSMAPQN